MIKKRIINSLVIAIIVVNLIALGFAFLGKKEKPHQRRKPPKQIIIKKLDFDKEQEKLYQQLIDEHTLKMGAFRSEMEQAKNGLYQNLAKETISKDSLIEAINKIQYKIEAQHYLHFQEIKNICRPDQIDKFIELSTELARLFSPGPPPHKQDKRSRN
ncbi:hypothetical protein OAB01_00620 [Bacteroidia bacterium]|nr:hypothetical protein [Bacteroidia bacterium]